MVKVLLGLASLLLVTTSALTTSAAASPTSPTPSTAGDIPVAGAFDYSPSRSAEAGMVRGVIHAVRRVPGGTVVYWSLGREQGGKELSATTSLTNQIVLGEYKPSDLAYIEVVDSAGLKQYRPMIAAGGDCLCSSSSDYPEPMLQAGTLYSGYVVVPPLPASVRTVTVNAFYGATVTGVPVQDGALEPVAAAAKGIVKLSDGWPTIPLDKIASVPQPNRFVVPLQSRTSDLQQTVRKQESPTQVTVDLAADVLFATDSARLSPAAAERLQAIAAELSRRGRGVVQVVGHTDSTGDPAHNRALSQQRAQSVLAALRPLVPVAPVTFQASGRGESEPQAPNGTPAGRQLNRRVTLTYTTTSK